MTVTRNGIQFEAWQFAAGFQRAPARARNLICTVAHLGDNHPHVHAVTGVHYLREDDWVLRRDNGNCVVLTPAEFAAQCAGEVQA
jgi:hypothetical protein